MGLWGRLIRPKKCFVFSPLQAAYRANRCVFMALIKVHNHIMMSLDQQKGVVLVLLDLSAAFDIDDHTILPSRLRNRFWMCDLVLVWLRLYMTGRDQSVVVVNTSSDSTALALWYATRFGAWPHSVLNVHQPN